MEEIQETVGKANQPEKKYFIMKVGRLSSKRQVKETGMTLEQAYKTLEKYKDTPYYYYMVAEQLFNK